ncbi:uncharacterized protein LOC118750122 [Rhagoletis pomonella]|uniref:uncharacterized protein LOC118750122 n=1 Tax=Rhagoletis pomonella TaxID=28610 RepID=UPI00177E3704|nr:uncharacterized protein LOC118750122 [Rhagoletis pomonella]
MSSKTDSSNKGGSTVKANIANILPMALIHWKSPNSSTRIMLIPLNLFDWDNDANNKTLKTLSVIREHAGPIEAFTENLMDSTEPTSCYSVPLASNNTRALLDQFSGHDDGAVVANDEEAPNLRALKSSQEGFKGNSVSRYENLERAVAEQDMNRIKAHDCFGRDLVVYVPENSAISSMQLAFEMDMSNIRDDILSTEAIKNIDMFKALTPKSLNDPTLKMTVNLDLGKSAVENKIPLDVNALIQGTLEIDPSKYTPGELEEIKAPTAANICSAALKKGFPAYISRMSYSTNSSENKEAPARDAHIVCVREGSKGCISPGNAEYPKFEPKPSSGKSPASKEAAQSGKAGGACISSEISLLSSEIIGHNSRGLMSCKAYARALVEATKRRAEISKDKCKPSDKTKIKKEATRKRDKCGDTKNPCTTPLLDECGKELKKDCPTRKKEDKKKKKDPCKDDPCKNASSKDKGTCRKPGSSMPCGSNKKKQEKDKEKKKDICGNSEKGNRCHSETDACRTEKDDCPKPKKGKCILDDPCKDPCEKEKKKKPETKKNCSSATPLLNSVKSPLPKKQEAVASDKETKCQPVTSLSDVKKSKSSSNCETSAKKSKSASDIKMSDNKCKTEPKKSSTTSCKPPGSKSDSGASDSSQAKCKPFNSVSPMKGSKSKTGSPKKSASDSNCNETKDGKSDSTNKEKCKRYEGFCTNQKLNSEKSESKSKQVKNLSDLKISKSSCSTDEKSGDKSKPIIDLCNLKKSKSTCATDKEDDGKKSERAASKCKPVKSLCDVKESKSSCSTDKKVDGKKSERAASKCKPVKSLCDVKESKSSCSTGKEADGKKSAKSKIECGTSKSSPSKSDSKDSCQKKKPTAPKCKAKPGSGSGPGAASGCKKYSTLTNPKAITEILPVKRFFSTISSYYVPHGLMPWRQFSSKKSAKGKKKDSKSSGMCMKLQSKSKAKRTDKPERKKPKTDCYADVETCQEAGCKDPQKSSCGKNKKVNKNLSPLRLRTCLQIAGPLSSLKGRCYGSDTHKEGQIGCYEETKTIEQCENDNDSDDCDSEDESESDANLINETRNEVIRIMEPSTVERCLEAMPNFSEYDVLVRTEAVALSGSDLHYYETGGESYPGMTLGHDATGVVEEVGCSITKLRPGDRVVIESGLACGICDYCKKGCYNICNQLVFNGFLRKYQVHPADLCHKIPDDVDMIEATLTQTLALGCQACFKAQVLPNTNLLVIGASPTAISTALCARAIGAGNICVASTMREPLEVIQNTFHFNCMNYEADLQYGLILKCLYSTLHAWPDAVINCAVSEKTLNLAVMALKPCGVCVLAECDTECACFNAMDVIMKNLKLLPSFRSINMFPTALNLIDCGKAPIGRLISRVFEWHQVEQAFRKALHESNVGNKKVIVRCAEEEDAYRKEDCKT